MKLKILVGLLAPLSLCIGQEIKPQYKPFVVFSADARPLTERLLNAVGLTKNDVGMSFALVVGVSQYPQMALTKDRELPAAAEDVRKLVAYLRDQEYFNEIVVLKDDALNYENLRYFLEVYFPARLKNAPKSRFLFAYSGHGFSEGKGPTGYLLKASARNFSDKENAINMNVVHDLLGGVVDAGHQVLALINACHSGAFLRQPFGGSVIPRAPGAHAITSGGTTEQSWHDPSLGTGSLFFEKLFTGLGGAADSSKDGVITTDELASYLKNQVSAFTDQNQNPRIGDLRSEGSNGSFFFLNRARPTAARLTLAWDPAKASSFGGDIPLAEFQARDYSLYYPTDWVNVVDGFMLLVQPKELAA